jgi:polyphosphate kinase
VVSLQQKKQRSAAARRPFHPSHFLNRELSWLEFNQRVLDEATDPRNPLLERLKFFCIVSSNLDEFFEIRIAGLKQQMEGDAVERSPDGLTATETFRAATRRIRQMVEDQYACWKQDLVPSLARHGIRLLTMDEVSESARDWLGDYYYNEVRPVLTPMAIDPAHPFPQLLNKSLNIIVQLESPMGGRIVRNLAVVQVPRVLPRVVSLPGEESSQHYLMLGHIIGYYLADLFPAAKILGYWHFRVTRNSELYIDEEETANLLKAVETELHNRRKGDAVRLEVDAHCPPPIAKALLNTLRITKDDLYLIDGPLNPTRLMVICEGDHSPALRFPPFVAPIARPLQNERDIFEPIRKEDILLHHPYDNFQSVVDFLEQAASDPDVLAIKQTLYRTGGDPRIVGALMTAVNNGKQVTAVVELRARFDEANNIQWARQLEEAGVQMVYGLVGYKIHAKVTLVVRRENNQLRRYVHLSTGNYNPNTARLYTDIGLLTCDRDFGEDATNLFNLLTGICQYQGMRKLMVAPFDLHTRMLELIQREARNAAEGLSARIIAKMNSLVDERIIEALYRASQAGVKIDLIVRGICCLRPGLKGISSNITVRSIVDRFLEHSRIFYFDNACRPEVYLSTADWMPRNFYRRIEVAFPVENGTLRDRLINEVLRLTLSDNTKARFLKSDGSYIQARAKQGEKNHRSQFEFIELATNPASKLLAKDRAKNKYTTVKLAPNPWTSAERTQKK